MLRIVYKNKKYSVREFLDLLGVKSFDTNKSPEIAKDIQHIEL